MANQKIHEYLNTATTIGDNDYYDVDKYDGVNYTSSKISGATIKSLLQCGVYSQTTEGTNQTGTTYNSILSGTGVGSLSVPANGFAVGDSFTAEVCGIISSVNNDDFLFQILGGPTSAITLLGGSVIMKTTTDKVFTLKSKFVIRAIGAAGVASIATYTEFMYNDNAANKSETFVFYAENGVTFDTTTTNVLDIDIKFSSANAGNQCRSELFTLHKVY
jgi:hypothetical protein